MGRFKVKNDDLASKIPLNKQHDLIVKKKSKVVKDDSKELKASKSMRKAIQEVKADSLPKEDLSSLWLNYSKRYALHIKLDADWTKQLLFEVEEDSPVPLSTRRRLKELAATIFKDDLEIYVQMQERKGHKDNKPFHKAILTHGTTKDKVAAMALVCMECPVYSLNSLFSLIDMVHSKFKNTYHSTIDTIVKLLQSAFLPRGHVVKEFECHSFSSLLPLLETQVEEAEKCLCLWYFEDQLRLAYLKLVKNLDGLCHDTIVRVRKKGLKGLEYLLKNHPKQDVDEVLGMLVNKFGDSNKKVAGDVVQALTRIQLQSPNVKLSLVSRVEELLYRPNISSKAQYYALCFLKDIIFTKQDGALAKRLIKLYFDFFQICSKKGEVDSHFMAALLRGVNRSYPYLVDKEDPMFEEQLNVLYKLTHLVKFNVASQTIQFLYQVQVAKKNELTDRFYNLLYGKLMDREFGTSSSCGAFLNVVFKSLVRDQNVSRVYSFLRRLLQVSHYYSARIACAVLFLLSEVIKDNTNLGTVMDFLLAKSDDAGDDVTKNELETVADDVDDDNDDDEFYPDLDNDDDDEKESSTESNVENGELSSKCSKMVGGSNENASKGKTDKQVSSWIHRENIEKLPVKPKIELEKKSSNYDLANRNPLSSGLHLNPMWELQSLKCHFHPSVSLFASYLLKGEHIIYSGDPLEDFTLTRFLDRFSHRNPKKMAHKNQSGSIFGNRSTYAPEGSRSIPVTSESFPELRENEVAPEDRFLHFYLTKFKKRKGQREPKSKRIQFDADLNEDGEDDDEVDDDEFDSELRRVSGFEHVFDQDDDEEEDDDQLNRLDFSRNMSRSVGDDAEHSDESSDDFDDSFEGDEDQDEHFDLDDDEDQDEAEFDGDDDDSLSDDCFGSDEESEATPQKSKKKKKEKDTINKKKVVKSVSPDWSDESDEEFSHLLESNGDDSIDGLTGTSEAVSAKRGTPKKQLIWEKKKMGSGNKTKSSRRRRSESKASPQRKKSKFKRMN